MACLFLVSEGQETPRERREKRAKLCRRKGNGVIQKKKRELLRKMEGKG